MFHRTCALGATAMLTLAAAAPAQTPAQTGVAPSESGQTRNPATPIVTAYPAAAAGDGATTNGFNLDRKSTRLNSSHIQKSRMPSSA